MRKLFLIAGSLLLLAFAAEGLLWLRYPRDPVKFTAFFVCFALLLAAFAGLTDSHVIRQLRAWAAQSALAAFGLPFLLLVPYLIFALGTETFTARGIGKLAAYIAAPVLLLAPDRLRHSQRAGWRDYAAMLALAWPVGAGWLTGIFMWPEDLYFFRPIYSVCVGAYAFMVIRNLEGVGYKLTVRWKDVTDALANLIAFAIIAIPLGIALGFLRPHSDEVSVWSVGFQFIAIYLTIAIPEELLFRGILQNFLVRSIPSEKRQLYGLLIASVIFGAAHLHHAPVPNWRYMILATIAGIFYGNVFRTRKRVSASATTHALVDTIWRFWL